MEGQQRKRGRLLIFASGYLRTKQVHVLLLLQKLDPNTQLIGSDWVWGLLVPEVSHRLPLIPGVGEGGKAHTAEHTGGSEVVIDDNVPGIGGREL